MEAHRFHHLARDPGRLTPAQWEGLKREGLARGREARAQAFAALFRRFNQLCRRGLPALIAPGARRISR